MIRKLRSLYPSFYRNNLSHSIIFDIQIFEFLYSFLLLPPFHKHSLYIYIYRWIPKGTWCCSNHRWISGKISSVECINNILMLFLIAMQVLWGISFANSPHDRDVWLPSICEIGCRRGVDVVLMKVGVTVWGCGHGVPKLITFVSTPASYLCLCFFFFSIFILFIF